MKFYKFGEEKILLVYDYLQNDEFVVDMYKAGVGIPYDWSNALREV